VWFRLGREGTGVESPGRAVGGSLSKKAKRLREVWNLSKLWRRRDLSTSPGVGQKFSPLESKVIIAGVSFREDKLITGPERGPVKMHVLPFEVELTLLAPWAVGLGEITVRWSVEGPVSPATFRQGSGTWKDKRNMECVNRALGAI
jgi:hypothetical protein